MKNIISENFIQELKNKTDILEIMGQDVGKIVKESADEYATYHKNKHNSESKKSLKINPEKGLYHCFNCGEGGNVINWLMNNRNMKFMESLKYLAYNAGMNLPNIDSEEQKKIEKQMQERKKIEKIYMKAALFFNSQLEEKHFDLLKNKYGINKETIDNLKIGFSPNDNGALKEHLIENTKYSWKILKKSGLFIKKYDFFQGRIIFPYWKNRKIVFFIGRKTEDTPDNSWEQGKYKKLLTHNKKHPYISETVENKYFFGEDTVYGSEILLITEGITDAIMSHQSGFSCISPVTVQFRLKDYPKLLNLTKKVETVYIANDNEKNKAGEKGAFKTAIYLMKNGVDVKIIKLPKQKEINKIDLAEFLRENTAEDLRKLMKQAKTPLQIGIEDVDSAPEDKKQEIAKEVVAPLIANLDEIRKEMYEKKLQKAFGGSRVVGIKAIRNLVENAKRKAQNSIREALKTDFPVPIRPLYENESGYYKKGNSEDENINLSNFKFIVQEVLAIPDEEEEVIVVDIEYSDGTSIKKEIQSKAFVSARNFRKSLPTKASWLGNNLDVQRLKINIELQNPTKRKGIKIAGRHKDRINLPEISINKNGPISDPEESLVYSNYNNFLRKLPKKWPDSKKHKEAAKGIYNYLTRINEPAIAGSVISWNFALPWCNLIRTQVDFGGFPHLIIWGEAGSGKTQTAKVIWRLNGISSEKEPFSLPNTKFTRLNNYSKTNLAPLFLDEYRPSAWHNRLVSTIHEELRNIYNKNTAERGTANLKTEAYPLVAPIILCGEDRPRDTTGLEERMVIARPNKDIINEEIDEYAECKNAFQNLQKYPLEFFALPYWRWTLKQNDWKEKLKTEKEKVIKWKNSEGLSIPERIINNLAILRFGWHMFNKYAAHLEIKVNPLINATIEDVLKKVYYNVMPGGKQFNEFDKLIDFISTMVNNQELIYRNNFAIRNDGVLVIKLSQVLPLVRKYAKNTDYKQEILSIDAYKQLVDRLNGREDSYIVDKQIRGYFGYNNDKKQLRGVGIDLDKLEKHLGIERDIWPK